MRTGQTVNLFSKAIRTGGRGRPLWTLLKIV